MLRVAMFVIGLVLLVVGLSAVAYGIKISNLMVGMAGVAVIAASFELMDKKYL